MSRRKWGGYCLGIRCSFRSHHATTLINNGQYLGVRSNGQYLGVRSTGPKTGGRSLHLEFPWRLLQSQPQYPLVYKGKALSPSTCHAFPACPRLSAPLLSQAGFLPPALSTSSILVGKIRRLQSAPGGLPCLTIDIWHNPKNCKSQRLARASPFSSKSG